MTTLHRTHVARRVVLVAVGWLSFVGCQSCHAGAGDGDMPSARSPAAHPQAQAPHAKPPAGGTRPALEPTATVALPHGAPGIGFDDLRFSPSLGAVLVPAGRSGRLDLVDADSRAVTAITGFSEQRKYEGGHDFGVTSAELVAGVVFATDRTTQRLAVVDPASAKVVRSVALAAHPDYVRYVEPTREVWVTEPDTDQIEIFALGDDGRHPAHAAVIDVRGGPESLVIDTSRSRAYTHLWRGATVAVDLRSRRVVARWDNGCRSSRGIALDEAGGFVVAACAEGKVTVLDVDDGRLVSQVETGGGVDVIDFDPRLRHVYVPSAATGTMAVAALAKDGQLSMIGRADTVLGAHCVTVARRGEVYVCDPAHGRLLVIHDGSDRARR